MGVSIHYKGRIGDPSRIADLRRHLLRFADTANWECLDLTQPENPQIVEMIISPPEACEPVFLLFDSQGRLHAPSELAPEGDSESLWCSVKTQDGPLDAHVLIVELLRQIKRDYLPDLEVWDEGRYWETENIETLRAARELLAGRIDSLGEVFSGARADRPGTPSEELCNSVEEATRKCFEIYKRRLQ
jgi:hypothetical protein